MNCLTHSCRRTLTLEPRNENAPASPYRGRSSCFNFFSFSIPQPPQGSGSTNPSPLPWWELQPFKWPRSPPRCEPMALLHPEDTEMTGVQWQRPVLCRDVTDDGDRNTDFFAAEARTVLPVEQVLKPVAASYADRPPLAEGINRTPATTVRSHQSPASSWSPRALC